MLTKICLKVISDIDMIIRISLIFLGFSQNDIISHFVANVYIKIFFNLNQINVKLQIVLSWNII